MSRHRFTSRYKQRKWKENIVTVVIIIFIWFFLYTLFSSWNIEYLEDNSDGWYLYLYSWDEVEGKSASVNVANYSDDFTCDWSNYDLILDGFTADIEVRTTTESYIWIDLKNLKSINDTNRKSIQFILYETAGEESVVLEASFNLYTKTGYSIKYAVKSAMIILGFVMIMMLKCISKTGRITLYVLYNLTCVPILVKYVYNCLKINPTEWVCIVLTAMFVLFVMLAILWGKTLFGVGVYTMVILFFSTYLLYQLSYIFSTYYIEAYDVFMDEEMFEKYYLFAWWETEYSRTVKIILENALCELRYCSYSFRYFFTIPPEEQYDLVSVFQFMLGKLYDLVVFGSVANYIIQLVKRDKKVQHIKEGEE